MEGFVYHVILFVVGRGAGSLGHKGYGSISLSKLLWPVVPRKVLYYRKVLPGPQKGSGSSRGSFRSIF